MEQQLMLFEKATPEQQEAVTMHFEVLEAAKKVKLSAAELGWKLKRMRDSGRFRELGFESFEAYTKTTIEIGWRQAYNYIRIVENLPPRMIEENAAAGITKLVMLSQLAPGDREEVAAEGLANITVAELQKLIEERNGLAEQLTMLQDVEHLKAGADPVAEVEGAEIDLEEIRRQAAEEARRDVWEEAKAQAAEMQERAATAARQEAKAETDRLIAAERKKAADEKAKLERQLKNAQKTAQDEQAAAIETARKEAFAEGKASAGAAARQAEEERAAALERAEALQKQLELAGDAETTRFLVLFDQLQATYQQMTGVLEKMGSAGEIEKADKLRAALGKALEAMMGK